MPKKLRLFALHVDDGGVVSNFTVKLKYVSYVGFTSKILKF